MLSTSLKIRGLVFSAILAISANYAVARAIPATSSPIKPSGNILSMIPANPNPVKPSGNILSMIPANPNPVKPSGNLQAA